MPPPARPDASAARARRARLILVCGLGGSGKTTLADGLARELNVACLHKDDVKTALHDAGIVTARSFDVFQALVERQLSNRVDLIIEATMHVPADWGLLRRWQDAFDVDLVCVICTADRAERERRIRERIRHPAHAAADRRQLVEPDPAVEYRRLPGAHIPITTDRDPSTSVRVVLDRLAALRHAR